MDSCGLTAEESYGAVGDVAKHLWRRRWCAYENGIMAKILSWRDSIAV